MLTEFLKGLQDTDHARSTRDIVVGPANFDFAAYINSYQGYTKLDRLRFLIDRSLTYKNDAKKALIAEIKAGVNTAFYYNCRDLLGGPPYTVDEIWIKQTESTNATKFNLLEQELLSAKSTMVKESIRIAQNDIANLQYQTGALHDAMKNYMRAKEFCTMTRHSIETYLNLAIVTIDCRQHLNTNNYLAKLTELSDGNVVLDAKIKAASGLLALIDGKYHTAAKFFLDVDPQLDRNFNNVIAMEDVALYGAICALATFSRSDLRTQLFEKKRFLNYSLSLVPAVKTLVTEFLQGNFGVCFKILVQLKPRLLLDVHLCDHVHALYKCILESALVQHVKPYSVLQLDRMAAVLECDVATVESLVADLIARNKLHATIDATNNTVSRICIDEREVMLANLVELTNHCAQSFRRDMMRLSVFRAGLSMDWKNEKEQQMQRSRQGNRRMRLIGAQQSQHDDDDEEGAIDMADMDGLEQTHNSGSNEGPNSDVMHVENA